MQGVLNQRWFKQRWFILKVIRMKVKWIWYKWIESLLNWFRTTIRILKFHVEGEIILQNSSYKSFLRYLKLMN